MNDFRFLAIVPKKGRDKNEEAGLSSGFLPQRAKPCRFIALLYIRLFLTGQLIVVIQTPSLE